ncbi:hypothetical protein GQ600_17624 [Phytophthora cactorum]|nr:hypothetical protein GQ600_17624 [Phytophthora cactorum]
MSLQLVDREAQETLEAALAFIDEYGHEQFSGGSSLSSHEFDFTLNSQSIQDTPISILTSLRTQYARKLKHNSQKEPVARSTETGATPTQRGSGIAAKSRRLLDKEAARR